MNTYVALLRAVNVGGTGKLSMTELKAMCEEIGFADVRTFIASGNVIFGTRLVEAEIKNILEKRLHVYAGKPVGVLVRTGAEMADVAAANPFAAAPGNRVTAIFLDHEISSAALAGITGRVEGEEVALGRREIFVHYGAGMATTKLRIPAARNGTARNMNTVARLAALAAA